MTCSGTTRRSRHLILRQSKTNLYGKMRQFSRKLPLYNFPILWNRHWGDNMHDQMSHSMLRRLVKSNFIDSYVEVVNCQNPLCRDCSSAQWFWALLLTFSLNDDLIFHYVCFSLGGLVPGGGAGYERILFSWQFHFNRIVRGCDENSKFCYL